MKRFAFNAAAFTLSITPALAGGGGSDEGAGNIILQTAIHLIQKLVDLF